MVKRPIYLHAGRPGQVILVLTLALTALALLGAAPGATNEDTRRRGWEPSLALAGGIAIHQHAGSGMSTVDVGINGSAPTVSPNFSLHLGVTTPAVDFLPLGPRFFLSGAIVPTVAFERDLAKAGDPRGFAPPSQEADGRGYPESAIDGTGSQVGGRIQPLVWSLDVGMEISHKFDDHTYYIRSSFGWTRFEVEVEGVVLRAIKPDYAPMPGFPRYVTLRDSETRPFDAYGGGVEVGVDLGKRGPIRPSLFIGGQVYGVPGDRTIGLSNVFSDSQGTEFAIWEYAIDPVLYRINIGMRVAWLGL